MAPARHDAALDFITARPDASVEDKLGVLAGKLSRPLTDEQLLGAYRVLNYACEDPRTALALLMREDNPTRLPIWCFYAIQDIPATAQALNHDQIKAWSMPMPVMLGAGDDTAFKAVVFGWAHDFYITVPICKTGRYEPFMQEHFKRVVRPGDTVFDIGANIGCHTALLAHLAGPGGRVEAFEPVPENYRNLREMARINGFAHVHCRNWAVSDTDSTRTIILSRQNIGGHGIEKDASAGGGSESLNIVCKALDSEYATLPRLDFIKMDIEGHEGHAVKGMKDLLQKHRPGLVMEFCPALLEKNGGAPWEMIGWLFSLYGAAGILETGETFSAPAQLSNWFSSRGGFVNIAFNRPC